MIQCVDKCVFLKKINDEFICTTYGVYLPMENDIAYRCKHCIADGNEWATKKIIKNVIDILDGGNNK